MGIQPLEQSLAILSRNFTIWASRVWVLDCSTNLDVGCEWFGIEFPGFIEKIKSMVVLPLMFLTRGVEFDGWTSEAHIILKWSICIGWST